MAKINWDEMLAGAYVQIEEGVPKELTLKNWRQQTQFKDEKTQEIKKGIVFDCYKDDNVEYDENSKIEWTVTAKGAMKLLKPIIEKADAAGKDTIKVSVVAVGKGTARKYSIQERI